MLSLGALGMGPGWPGKILPPSPSSSPSPTLDPLSAHFLDFCSFFCPKSIFLVNFSLFFDKFVDVSPKKSCFGELFVISALLVPNLLFSIWEYIGPYGP